MKPSKPVISPERKTLYYVGQAIVALGLLLFLSNFVLMIPSGRESIGDGFSHMRWFALRGVGGMVLMIAGSIMTNIGARGSAGAGLVLDPEKAREQLEPWSRLSGQMTNDYLSEIDVVQKIADRVGGDEPDVVKVRCRSCQALNDEAAKFCSQCGKAV